MEIFLLLVVLVIMIFLFRNLTDIKNELTHLQHELLDLKKLISSGPSRPFGKARTKSDSTSTCYTGTT